MAQLGHEMEEGREQGVEMMIISLTVMQGKEEESTRIIAVFTLMLGAVSALTSPPTSPPPHPPFFTAGTTISANSGAQTPLIPSSFKASNS